MSNTYTMRKPTQLHSNILDYLTKPLFGTLEDPKQKKEKSVVSDSPVSPKHKKANKLFGMQTSRLVMAGISLFIFGLLLYTVYSLGSSKGATVAGFAKDREYMARYGAVERYMITPEMRAQAEIINYACENGYIKSPCSKLAVMTLMAKTVIPDQTIPGTNGKK